MAHTKDDVITSMKYAIAGGLELSIKSSGHCYSGNCMRAESLPTP